MKFKLILLIESVFLIIISFLYLNEIQLTKLFTQGNQGAVGELVSPYVGDLDNQVKTISSKDLESLGEGSGVAFGGMAKAAELNGYPGPRHILEMSDELSLTEIQQERIEKLYDEMREKAITLGEEIIKVELDLNTSFANEAINSESLTQLVKQSADLYAELRTHHLQYHLQTITILTEEQVVAYNELRGYMGDPCENIPEGHDLELWNQHNDCE